MPRNAPADTLSQIQRLILEVAAHDPEHRLTRPEAVKAPTYRSALQALRRRGLIADGLPADGARHPTAPVLTKDADADAPPENQPKHPPNDRTSSHENRDREQDPPALR